MNEKKKTERLVRINQILQRQDERVKDLAQQNQKLEILKKEETLAKRYSERDAILVQEDLQNRKNKLMEIKKQNKPIDLNEINDHDQKFLHT